MLAKPISPLLMSMTRSSLRFLSEFVLIFFFAIILLLGKYRMIRMILTVFPRRHSIVPLTPRATNVASTRKIIQGTLTAMAWRVAP